MVVNLKAQSSYRARQRGYSNPKAKASKIPTPKITVQESDLDIPVLLPIS